MSVLIMGFEMPTARDTLVLVKTDGTAIVYEDEAYVTTAVPVPPHGDLIERDAAYDKIAEQEGGNYVDMDVVDMGLNETPTIIPAEEEEA